MASDVPAIDTHPQKQRIIDAILRGDAVRSIAKWVDPPLHWTTIGHYRKTRVVSALRQQGEIAKVLKENEFLKQQIQTAGNAAPVLVPTKKALMADPIIDRVDWFRNEVVSGIEDSKAAGDLKARASFVAGAWRVVDMEARALMHPGFVPGATVTNIDARTVVVMPSSMIASTPIGTATPAITASGDIIDVDAL